MYEAGKAFRSLCTGETFLDKSDCRLHSMRLAQSQSRSESEFYEIVPDGKLFAIAVRGEVEVHGLEQEDLPQARNIVEILNSFIKSEKAG